MPYALEDNRELVNEIVKSWMAIPLLGCHDLGLHIVFYASDLIKTIDRIYEDKGFFVQELRIGDNLWLVPEADPPAAGLCTTIRFDDNTSYYGKHEILRFAAVKMLKSLTNTLRDTLQNET